MKITLASRLVFSAGLVAIVGAPSAFADGRNNRECAEWPSYAALKAALNDARREPNGGCRGRPEPGSKVTM